MPYPRKEINHLTPSALGAPWDAPEANRPCARNYCPAHLFCSRPGNISCRNSYRELVADRRLRPCADHDVCGIAPRPRPDASLLAAGRIRARGLGIGESGVDGLRTGAAPRAPHRFGGAFPCPAAIDFLTDGVVPGSRQKP